MTELLDVIQGRRSIRKYTDQDVSEEDIKKLIQAVKWSPSWTNCQCWEVIVVRNTDTKEKIQATLSKKNPAKKAIVQAPVLLAICAKKMASGYYNNTAATKFGDSWFMYDLGMATQNLCLMAFNMGLGTVVVGLYDHDIAKKILNIPEEYELVTIIPVGYPVSETNPPKRRNIEDIIHIEFF